jgi:signal transduction histidine kinase
MSAWWRQHWLAVYIGWSFLIGLISVIELSLDLGRPFPGLLDHYNPIDNSWRIYHFTPAWWPGLNNGVIRYNDTLLELNGQPYTANARQVYAAAYAAGDRQVTLTLQRNQTILTQEIALLLFTPRYLLDLKTANYMMGICFWLLAVAIYRAQPRAPLNRAFTLTCAQFALTVFALPASIFRHATGLEHFTLFVANPLTMSLAWAHVFKFTILFPEPIWQGDHRLHRGLRRWATPIVYGIAVTMAISGGLALLLFWTKGWSPLVSWLDWWGRQCPLYGLGLLVIFVVLRCLWDLRPGIPAHQRQRMLLVVIGLVLFSPSLIVIIFPGLINVFPGRLDLRFLALAVPISIAAIILRYRTFLAARTGFVIVTEIAISAVLASLATAFVPDPGDATSLPPFVPIFIATFLASQFWGWMTSSKGWLWNLLYREELAQRSVKDFGQDVAQSFTSIQLPSVIANALIHQFRSDVAVIYRSTESNLALTGHAGAWKPPEHLPAPLSKLAELTRPALIGADANNIPAWLEPLQSSGRIEIVAPLFSVDQPVGLLGIGRREGEEIFDIRDADAVEIVAQQCALFLQAAEQLEALRRVPLEIEQAQEQERQRIAIDLHDSLQQFLGGLQFPLELSRKLVTQDPAKTDAYLSQMIRDVDRSAKILRQISHNLMPRDLQKGMREPLQALVEEFRVRRSLDIRLVLPEDLDEGLGLDERHAIRSVVRQALDNIVAHAHATRVEIEFNKSEGRLEFLVADNGCGFSEADRQRAQAEKRLGLISMPARIVAVRGELKIESEPEHGTRVRGWVPCHHGVSEIV